MIFKLSGSVETGAADSVYMTNYLVYMMRFSSELLSLKYCNSKDDLSFGLVTASFSNFSG